MVGVVEYLVRFVKSRFKVITLVHKLPDKLRDSDNGVSIIELDSNVLFKLVKVSETGFVLCKRIGYRSGREEILLLESELLSLICVVIRIKHTGDVLSAVYLSLSACVVAVVELSEIKSTCCFSLPQTQIPYVVRAVADYWHIVRHSPDSLICIFNKHSVLLAAF